MKLVYGTTNAGKLQHMQQMLEGLDLEIAALNNYNFEIAEIDESGNNPLENAAIKAKAYYKVIKTPIFSCDSALYIEGVDNAHQPGVHVRRVKGKSLSDEEMIQYYSQLSANYGDNLKAFYKNAVCLVLDKENIFLYDGKDISSKPFILSSKPHHIRREGFPLDSLSIDISTGKYFVDNEIQKTYSEEYLMAQGFRSFFQKYLNI